MYPLKSTLYKFDASAGNHDSPSWSKQIWGGVADGIWNLLSPKSKFIWNVLSSGVNCSFASQRKISIWVHSVTPSHGCTHLLIVISVNKKGRLLLQRNMVHMDVMLVKMAVLLQTYPGKSFLIWCHIFNILIRLVMLFMNHGTMSICWLL